MKKQNAPHARFFSSPFVNGYTDIEKEIAVFTIGSSEVSEDIFEKNLPEYIHALCKLSAKSEFPNVTISAGYRTSPSGKTFVMEKKLYDNSEISMKDMVSEISIEFVCLEDKSENLKNILPEDPIIYRKTFQIQNASKRIPNYPSQSEGQSGIFVTKSEAHPFAGAYFNGISLHDIQPYLFYVGTNPRGEPYIKSISATEALQTGKVDISKEINSNQLSTLEDNICNGDIQIELDGTTYRSLYATKQTLTSNVFSISFKRKEVNHG